MRVKFLKDVFDAGTKAFEAGKEYEGDHGRHVRRGLAVAVAVKAAPVKEQPKQDKADEKKAEKK